MNNKKGFDVYGIHRDTGTKYNLEGYNRYGYDEDGYDKEGYNKAGFNRDGIHKETGTKYNLENVDVNGYSLSDIQKISRLLNEYIDGNYDTIGKFRQQYNISKNVFNKMVKCMEIYNKPLYDKVIDFTASKNKKRFISMISIIEKTLEKIKTGVTDAEGNVREYDYIDYFLEDSARLNLENFEKLFFKIEEGNIPENRRLYNKFMSKYKRRNKFLLNWKQEKDVTRSYVIEGVPYVVSLEEKEKVIEYMKAHKIPLEIGFYNVILSRYIHGMIDLTNKEEIINSRKM